MICLTEAPDPFGLGRIRIFVGGSIRAPGHLDDRQTRIAKRARYLRHRRRVVGDVFENVVAQHEVDGPAPKWQRREACLNIQVATVGPTYEIDTNVATRRQPPEDSGDRTRRTHVNDQPGRGDQGRESFEQEGEKPVSLQPSTPRTHRVRTPARALLELPDPVVTDRTQSGLRGGASGRDPAQLIPRDVRTVRRDDPERAETFLKARCPRESAGKPAIATVVSGASLHGGKDHDHNGQRGVEGETELGE